MKRQLTHLDLALLSALAVQVAAPAGQSAHAQPPRAECASPTTPVVHALIDMERLNQVSGVAASDLHDGLLWAVNGLSDAAIYGIDTDGRWRATLVPAAAGPMTYTDIAVRDGFIYLLDVTDDGGIRVHRMREPATLPAGPPVTSPAWGEDAPRAPELEVQMTETVRSTRTRYSHTEALYVDARGQVFFITKGEHTVVYSLGGFGGSLGARPAREVMRLDIPGVVAADIARDGLSLVVRSATHATVYRADDSGRIIPQNGCPVALGTERAGTAIAFDRDGTAFWTLGTGRTALYRVPLEAE